MGHSLSSWLPVKLHMAGADARVVPLYYALPNASSIPGRSRLLDAAWRFVLALGPGGLWPPRGAISLILSHTYSFLLNRTHSIRNIDNAVSQGQIPSLEGVRHHRSAGHTVGRTPQGNGTDCAPLSGAAQLVGRAAGMPHAAGGAGRHCKCVTSDRRCCRPRRSS